MRLQLENFRCYEKETFDFGKNGQVLLTGPSGQGKTTILMAIFFALFGQGRKVVTQGKTSCRVTLEFEGTKITRTKSPNRLLVNDVLEDAAGQEAINRLFGTSFDVTGYVEQSGLKSFILMSPSDKLEFLERHAFHDTDLGEIKKRNRIHIAQCKEELTVASTEFRMVEQCLLEMRVPVEVDFPLKYKGSRERAITNEQIRKKNCTIRIQKAEHQKSKIVQETQDIKILETKLRGIQENYDYIASSIAGVKKEITRVETEYNGDRQLRSSEDRLARLVAHREFLALGRHHEDNLRKLEEMRTVEEARLVHQVSAHEAELWSEHSREEIGQDILDLKDCIKDLENIASLEKSLCKHHVDEGKHTKNKQQLADWQSDVAQRKIELDKALLQKQLYSCPSCRSKLRLVGNLLALADDPDSVVHTDIHALKEEIQILGRDIGKLQCTIPVEEQKLVQYGEDKKTIESISSTYDELPELEDVKEDVSYLHQYQRRQLEVEQIIDKGRTKLRSQEYSSSFTSFKASVEETTRRIQAMSEAGDGTSDDVDEEMLREEIVVQKGCKGALVDLSREREQLVSELEHRQHTAEETASAHISVYGAINDSVSLQNKIDALTNTIQAETKAKELHDTNLRGVDAWRLYQKEAGHYQDEVNKTTMHREKEGEARNRFAAATELRERISEAESISMSNIVDSINTHARIYTDAFFQDHPISVQLQAFKESKKKEVRPAINIVIDYKGLECDMTMLSGGEQSRVVLAYTLALAEMFHTPLMLLDECTSSLDQELTSVVFEAIKSNFNGTMILIIAHQIIQGTFDKVIQLAREK